MAKRTNDDIEALRKDLLIEEELLGARLRFHTTWGLFSPRHVDAGSKLLLDHIEVARNDRVLDLGCGYGALGLAIATQAKEGEAELIDKDFVAVEYARKNALLNGLTNVRTGLSNGFDQVIGRDLTLIVSNLPAKTSNEQYRLFFHDARSRLSVGGAFVVVTITGLREFVARQFKETFGNYEKLKQRDDYTVARAIR